MDNTYIPLVPTEAESIVISDRLKSISQIFDFECFAYFPKDKNCGTVFEKQPHSAATFNLKRGRLPFLVST
jgi:hypothetical protein